MLPFFFVRAVVDRGLEFARKSFARTMERKGGWEKRYGGEKEILNAYMVR